MVSLHKDECTIYLMSVEREFKGRINRFWHSLKEYGMEIVSPARQANIGKDSSEVDTSLHLSAVTY